MRKERILKLISQKQSFIALIIIVLVSICSSVLSGILLVRDGLMKPNERIQSTCDASYNDNIGYRSFSELTCFPVIDAVYTWVNGSDPLWFAEMQYYKSQYRKDHNITDVEENASYSLNRFRDNDELKYSLRSLEKNAPWIHHIYVVTNGQIPTWLDLSNPKLTIVTHKEIFRDQASLPTFSSPSIEMNLHHIPGLSDYFIYFNDDVFLGSPVIPADFISLQKGQLLYTSWEVPECSEFCNYSMLGNDYCDAKCNNPQCGYDFGDCDSVPTVELSLQEKVMELAQKDEECNEHCPHDFLDNDACNEECNVAECGFDGGDCQEPTDYHYSLLFHCHDEGLNLTSTLKLTKTQVTRAQYYIEKEYMMEPESYCITRVIVEQSSYVILHLPESVTSIFTVDTLECLEPDTLVHMKYNQDSHTVFAIVKPSLVTLPFTLHFVAFTHTEQDTSSLLIIDVLRMNIPAYSSIVSFFNERKPIDLKLSSTATVASMSYVPCPLGSYTTFMFSFNDPWPDVQAGLLTLQNFTHLLFPGKEVSFLRFESLTRETRDNPDIVFDTSYQRRVIDGTLLSGVPQTIFKGNGHLFNMVTLSVSKRDTMNELVRFVRSTYNYNHPSYYSFDYWKENRKAYLGLDVDVYDYITKLPYSRYIRTCNDVFNSRRADFSTGDRFVFWREVFEYYDISTKHDEVWNLFRQQKLPDIDYFSDFETIEGYHSFFTKHQYSRVVLAVPIIEVVTCWIDRSNQPYMSIDPGSTFYIREDEQRPGEVILKKEALSSIQLSGSSKVYRHGSTSAVVFFDSLEASDSFKDFKQLMRTAGSSIPQSKPRKLTDYDLMLEEDRVELQSRNIRHLTDYLHRYELLKNGRRLGDSYRESLVHTNLQLIKMFGNTKRYVPAHMPHFINKHLMEEIEGKLGKYVNETVSHRFREGNDLQYAFLYFHYLIGKENLKADSYIEDYWHSQIDTNHNGIVDENEFKTLAAIVFETDITRKNQRSLLSCLVPNITMKERIIESKQSLFLHQYYPLNITFGDVMNCSLSNDALHSLFPFEARYQSISDGSVAFQMINDNVNETRSQLNSVRKRQSKFVCINDNIQNKTEELDEIIHSFYESFFPIPSSFEKRNYKGDINSKIRKIVKYLVSLKNIPDLMFYCLEVVVVVAVFLVISLYKRISLRHKSVQVEHAHDF